MGGGSRFVPFLFVFIAFSATCLPGSVDAKRVKSAKLIAEESVAPLLHAKSKNPDEQEYGAEFKELAEAVFEGKEPALPVETAAPKRGSASSTTGKKSSVRGVKGTKLATTPATTSPENGEGDADSPADSAAGSAVELEEKSGSGSATTADADTTAAATAAEKASAEDNSNKAPAAAVVPPKPKKAAKKKWTKKAKGKKPKWKPKPKAPAKPAPAAKPLPATTEEAAKTSETLETAAADSAETAESESTGKGGAPAEEGGDTEAGESPTAAAAASETEGEADEAPELRSTSTSSLGEESSSVEGGALSKSRFIMAPPAVDGSESSAFSPLLKTAKKYTAPALDDDTPVDRDFPLAEGKRAPAAKVVTGLDAKAAAEEAALDGAAPDGEEAEEAAPVAKLAGSGGKGKQGAATALATGAAPDAEGGADTAADTKDDGSEGTATGAETLTEPGQDEGPDTDGTGSLGAETVKGKRGALKSAVATEDSAETPEEGDTEEPGATTAVLSGKKAPAEAETEGDEAESTETPASGEMKGKAEKSGLKAASGKVSKEGADTGEEEEGDALTAAAGSNKGIGVAETPVDGEEEAPSDEVGAEGSGSKGSGAKGSRVKGSGKAVEVVDETEGDDEASPTKAKTGKASGKDVEVAEGDEDEATPVGQSKGAVKAKKANSGALDGGAEPEGDNSAGEVATEESEGEETTLSGKKAGGLGKTPAADVEATEDDVAPADAGVKGAKTTAPPLAEAEEPEEEAPSNKPTGKRGKGKIAVTETPEDDATPVGETPESSDEAATAETEGEEQAVASPKRKKGALPEAGAAAAAETPENTDEATTAEAEGEEQAVAAPKGKKGPLSKAGAAAAAAAAALVGTTAEPTPEDDETAPLDTKTTASVKKAADTEESAEGDEEAPAGQLSGLPSKEKKAAGPEGGENEGEEGEGERVAGGKAQVKGAGAEGVDNSVSEGKGKEATQATPSSGAAADEEDSGTKPLQDISSSGNCSVEIPQFCVGVQPGGANILDCLSKKILAETPDSPQVSAACKAEIRAFKILMYTDMTMDAKMQIACNADVSKFCDNDILYPEPGSVLACLREIKDKAGLTDQCKAEVFRAQQDGARDLAMDVQLAELCQADAAKLCKGVPEGEGRVHECLRGQRERLGWDCQAELFRQEVENADDIRLNVRLFKACLADKRQFCADVIPGDARVKDCLEDHHEDPAFSPGCREEFTKMMARRAQDFRLDSNLRKFCKKDIDEICYPAAEDSTEIANHDGKVIQCLQDFREELKGPSCRAEVHKLTARAAEDIRFDKPLADACQGDRKTLCADVPDGGGLVLKCLEEKREKLRDECKTALFGQEVRSSFSIDYKYALKRACKAERKLFCAHVPPGHADVISCLERKVDDPEMGAECQKELRSDEWKASTDYRLNFRLNKACVADVATLCPGLCPDKNECGGAGLKCLAEKMEAIKSEACKKEVFNFEQQMVADVQLDVPLQKACAADLERLCPRVSKDHSRTLACLRSHRDELAEACKEEEMRFSIMEASDIRLTPTLMNACGQELARFCKAVPPTEGRAFKCLQARLEDVDMGSACWAELNLQEARHSSNYRLDVRVRKECEADVGQHCEGVDKGHEGHALVLKCLVDKFKALTASCQTEVSYSVRMALWQYRKGADLTQACDEMVSTKCPAVEETPDSPTGTTSKTGVETEISKGSKSGSDSSSSSGTSSASSTVVGVYGQCLMQAAWKDLNADCKKLVRVASKEGAHVGGKHDEERLQETLQKLAALQFPNGSPEEGGSGLVLSGTVALAAIAAGIIALLGCGCYIYFRCCRRYRPYTLIVNREGA
eukprot:TRINITY_DN562_c0_g3_i1.p1 TRINITY_DN562_c0_g3~~TRINITY_DN562_c0_g3_i1.p1  ORF type:complete len:1830 (+),score=464.44 TRINITY_DN562_c0_g3_i1:323-5812(+)